MCRIRPTLTPTKRATSTLDRIIPPGALSRYLAALQFKAAALGRIDTTRA